MQLTKVLYWNSWMKNGRRPARPPFRFTEVKPLKLKDSVSSQTKLSKDVVCISQMMEMMSCLKANDFDQNQCLNQITSFQTCYNQYSEAKKDKKLNKDQKVASVGQMRLNKDQLNVLLNRYPQPK